ncbi:MAG TPA: hypothetical protein VE959_34580 [Bryobacteraceae bacterium]|nr:hypothetical protein [Bryobacteraceae bacterium]
MREAPFLVQAAGLLATGWLIWLTSLSPRIHRFTWSSLIGHALGYALLAWVWSAVITFALYLAVPAHQRRDVLWTSFRTAGAAVWFAPAIILLTQLSPAALAPALVLVVTATRLLYCEWRLRHPPLEDPAPLPYVPGTFGENQPPPPFFLNRLAPALVVALCIQAGVIAIWWRFPLLAAGLFAAGAAVLTINAVSSGAVEVENPRNLPRAILGVLLTLVLASGLTVGGLSGRVIHRPGLGGAPSAGVPAGLLEKARALLRSVLYGEQPPGEASDSLSKATPELPGNAFPPGSFPGVVLTSEVRPVPLLVTPMPANRALFGASAQTYSIPFGGEYWLYRWLYRKPPLNSYRQKGDPAALSFSTTDHWPLMMEARQKLDQPIDLRCCSTVRVDIWNADRNPGAVTLQLFAWDTGSPAARSTPLGSASVHSAPDLRKDPAIAVPETLEFPIPPDVIENCTEFQMVFRRSGDRMDRSTRIAIDRFLLVPR